MSISEIVIKGVGVALAIIGLLVVLVAAQSLVAAITVASISVVIIGVLLIGAGAYIVRGGTLSA